MVTLISRGRLHVLFLLLSSIATYKTAQADVCETLLAQTYQKLHLDSMYTSTTAYLAHPDLRSSVDSSYSFKMEQIGLNYFTTLFSDIFKREIDFADTYHVFYHGQRREFILLQDIYDGLYGIARKKKLQDFVMLRVPNKELKKYKNVKEFISYFLSHNLTINDCAPDIQKLLLSVSPSLFSNTHCPGECSFYYFINSSNATDFNKMNFVESAFKSFKYEHYFSQYEKEIQELQALLAAYEKDKTGTLLQIFVPKTVVNTIAYRCKPWGVLYHPNEKHEATTDLERYEQRKDHSYSYDFDATQFRILMTEAMTDPQQGVKIFRYCNTTTNLTTYKARLKMLLDKIANEELAKGVS